MKISDFVTNSVITLTAVAAGLFVAWGFSGRNTTTVQGVVKLDGQAVPWADVVFVSDDPNVAPVAVKADQAGQYQVNAVLPSGPYRILTRGTAAKPNAVLGARADELDEYQQQMLQAAQLQKPESAKAIPKSYGTVATSPLQTEIVDGESVEFHLQLTTGSKQLADGKQNQSTTVR